MPNELQSKGVFDLASTKNRRRRRGSDHLTGMIVFIIVAAVFILLSTTIFFNVETLVVTGASNYTAEEIIAASGIQPGDNIVRLNDKKCCEQIEAQLVYIESCTIKRTFPSTLTINVEASVPAANFINDDNTVMLISSTGKILEMSTEARTGLLNFVGTSPAEELTAGMEFISQDEIKNTAITELMDYFATHDYEKIDRIDVTDRSDISYVYDGRITVKLGSITDLEYKMKFSDKIVTTKIGDKTEGILTLLNETDGASFLDKESLENNARIFNDNMSAQSSDTDNEDTVSEGTSQTSDNTPIME